MAQIYDKNGICIWCKGTNICHKCKGSGKTTLSKNSVFPKGTEVPCPECYGGGDCKSCRGIKKPIFSC